jgi:hypothetical protein
VERAVILHAVEPITARELQFEYRGCVRTHLDVFEKKALEREASVLGSATPAQCKSLHPVGKHSRQDGGYSI